MCSVYFYQNHKSGPYLMTKNTHINIQHACLTACTFFREAAVTDMSKTKGLFSGIKIMANFTSLLEPLW